MASRFVLTAQVQLQAPTNTRQVVNQIQRQLKGVNVNLNLKGGQQASRQINNLNRATKQATTQANKMGKAFGASIRRFGAFTIATRAVSLFTSGLANATKEAIAFEREMIKISQVTGKTMSELKGLENTITNLATSLGVSSKSILSVGRILAQAGIQAGDLKVALTALAKTELAPTFDDITKTAEGAVAVLAQFGEGVGALERQLGAINRVAGQFAVESGDLISVIRRTGGVFKAAGGDLNELIALFTSVRATTRESAESIATGLRTIFTRIQRPKTIEFLKQFGVELTDLNGKFVGPFEAIKQLSAALSGLGEGDIQFVRIAEELGGFRQIGKVIPLLQQFETAERARQAALEGGDSLTKDTATAQKALAVQIAKVKEEFLALIRGFSQTSSFQTFVKTSLELASALIKIADALKPLLPLLTAFAAVKFARGAAGFARGIGSGLRGGARGFARGGMVPGTGNRDTVPAMLTPGEFVIRKSSVSKLGAGTLSAMNENKFSKGGLAKLREGQEISLAPGKIGPFKKALLRKSGDKDGDAELDIGGAFLQPQGIIQNLRATIQGNEILKEVIKDIGGTQSQARSLLKNSKGASSALSIPISIQSGSLSQDVSSRFRSGLQTNLTKFSKDFAGQSIPGIRFAPSKFRKAFQVSNREQIEGGIFESFINGLSDKPFDNQKINPNDVFDFRQGLGAASKVFGLAPNLIADAKRTFNTDALASLTKKGGNAIIQSVSADLATQLIASGAKGSDRQIAARKALARRNSGGGISGSDTVPALLTPGEFVFNKKAAKSIGYSNLSRMNTQGVKGFAKGGPVGFANGGPVSGSANMALTKAEVQALAKSIDKQVAATEEGTKQQKESTKQQKSATKAGSFAERRAMVKAGIHGKRTSAARAAAAGGGSMGGGMGIMGITAIAAMIPDLENASSGMRAVANEGKNTVIQLATVGFALQAFGFNLKATSKDLMGRLKGFGKGLGVALIAGFAVKKFGDIIDSYNGIKQKAIDTEKKAIETGKASDIAKAAEAAATVNTEKSMTKLAMGLAAGGAAVGAAFGPIGAAVGGVVGGLAGLALKLGVLENIFGVSSGVISDAFAAFGIGQFQSQIKANTKFTIENTRAKKILAEATKKAAEELKKVQAGEITVQQAVGEGGVVDQVAQAIGRVRTASGAVGAANKQQERFLDATEKTGFGRLISGFTGARGKLAQSEASRQKELEGLGTQLVQTLQPFTNELTKSLVTSAAAGGGDGSSATFLDFTDSLSAATIQQLEASGSLGKLKEQFENQKQAVIDNIKFVKAMNFGLSAVTSGIDAYGASLNNIIESQETGFSTAAVAANTLSTAISSAGANVSNAQLGKSLDLLENNLQKFGANAKQITGARDLITGLNDVQKGAANALAAVKAGFDGGNADPQAIQGQLRDAILGAIPDDSPIKEKLISAFPDELPPEVIQDFLNSGDVSGILDQAFGPIEESVKKQLIEPLNAMGEQEKLLTELAQKRREAELKLIAVQQKAIDTQIDAAKSLEFFGGAKFTPEKEFDARRRQANLTLQDAGVAGLATGSAADIRAASASIMSNFSRQQSAQNASVAGNDGIGAFGGASGVDRDRRSELKSANQALITITKQGIEQRKQELELIRKKNQAEKSALDSLLGGDVESFFDQSIAAAAGSALRTGDSATASLFGASALGKGLQGLQGTGLSDAQNKRASQLAFGAFGLGDRAASVFSGTTTEEEKIKSEGRELAQLQSELADQSVDLEQMTVDAQTVVITAANLDMDRIRNQVMQTQAIAGYNKGGVVYANRGMFIPRGTDTVPAMLTPGEFVVNRAAVQRGNNLQILRSMNSNSAPIQAAQGLSSGGPVRYRSAGSTGPEPAGSMDFSKFEDLVNKFQDVIGSLPREISMKLADFNANMNFSGLQSISDLVSNEVSNKLGNALVNERGQVVSDGRSSVLDSMNS